MLMDESDMKELFLIRQQFRDHKIPKSQLEKTHVEFTEKFSQCFDMICSESCDDMILNKMLNARRLVSSGNMTQHDASVLVGQNLVDKYVIPTMESQNQ